MAGIEQGTFYRGTEDLQQSSKNRWKSSKIWI